MAKPADLSTNPDCCSAKLADLSTDQRLWRVGGAKTGVVDMLVEEARDDVVDGLFSAPAHSAAGLR
jgi:hypothetical protein